MATKRNFTDEQVAEMCELLLSGETTTSLGEVYECSNTTVRDTVMRVGLVYKGAPGHGKWVQGAKPLLASVTELDQRVAQLRSDLAGKTEVSGAWLQAQGQTYGLGRSTVNRIAHAAGLEFTGTNQFDGKWVRKQEQAMNSNGEWKPEEDYASLVMSDRERVALEQTVVEAEAPSEALLTSDDDDLRQAARLVDRLTDQRLADKTLIADLDARIVDLKAALEARDAKVLQLASENKRLMNENKTAFSRGLLRQSIGRAEAALG